MAVQFHELPVDVFSPEARPFIARLNHELRELFALEGVIRQPLAVRRSDASVVRRATVQVHTSRITPSIAGIVSGASTVVGTPALVFGTVNTVGSTTTALSVNSAVRLFDTTVPEGVSTGGAVGTAGLPARRDHVHAHPVLASGDLHTDLLPLSGVRNMSGEFGTSVGTFRSDVVSGGTGFRFRTSNSFSAGTLWQVDDSGTVHHDISFEGHHRVADATAGLASQAAFRVNRTLNADSRASFAGIFVGPGVAGVVPGGVYNPTHTGVDCTYSFGPTSFPTLGSRTIRGGRFLGALTSGATGSVATLAGGLFVAQDNGTWGGSVTTAVAGDFSVLGPYAGVLTNAYGIRQNAIAVGANRWGGNFSNRVAVASPAADAQEVLGLSQLNTGAAAGVHIKFNDKAGDPPAPVAGDLWRNGDELYLQSAARSEGLARYIPRAKWAVD